MFVVREKTCFSVSVTDFSKCDLQVKTKFTKSSGLTSQLKLPGSSVGWRCHQSSYFKSSSSFLHTLWTGSRGGGGQVNFPHSLLDNRHCQTYPAQAISASHNDSLVAMHKTWNFTSGDGISVYTAWQSTVFFLYIYSYLFCALHLLLCHGSICLHQAGRVRLKKQ